MTKVVEINKNEHQAEERLYQTIADAIEGELDNLSMAQLLGVITMIDSDYNAKRLEYLKRCE